MMQPLSNSKRHTIQLIIAGAAIVAMTIIWIKNPSKKNTSTHSESKYKEQRDSITTLLSASQERERWYILQLEKDSAGMAELKSRIKSRDTKIKSYETKFKEIDNLRINDLDSFFIAIYPDSLQPGK